MQESFLEAAGRWRGRCAFAQAFAHTQQWQRDCKGLQKGCSAKTDELEHCNLTGQLSLWRTITANRRVSCFSICQPGHGQIMLHMALGEGKENMNKSQFSERSVSCAAAAVWASPNSTSYCFGSRDHTIPACFLTWASSQLLSSPFSACLQEQLALWKKSK